MIDNLAYVIFGSPAADEWRTFGTDIIGGALAENGPASDVPASDVVAGEVRLRIDDRPWRLAVRPSDSNELIAIGWDVTADQLDETITAVESFGCGVTRNPELAAARDATEAAWFIDPFGLRHELVVGIADGEPFSPNPVLHGDFITGPQGMGHIVLMVPNLAEATSFVTDGLGMRLSDTIDIGMTLLFFHCHGTESRHHTIALSEVPGRRGVHHIMIEYSDPDDVGRAFDRVRDAGYTLSMDYGRHPNDLVTSFYVRTPSGFDLEVGSGGVTIDDANWTTADYDAMSLWGHRPPSGGPPRPEILEKIDTASAQGGS